MSYVDEIEELWKGSNEGNLSQILHTILELIDTAKTNGEEIHPSLELEIYLSANYAIGFGGTPAETRALADLYYRIILKIQEHETILTDDTETVFENLDITSKQVHRLGCTVASATVNLLTSDEHHNVETAAEIISWKDLETSTADTILLEQAQLLIKGLKYGTTTNWSLELFTFVLNLLLLYQDITGTQVSEIDDSHMDRQLQNFITRSDRGSNAWDVWQGEWLEKTDYYRFVTLLLTQKSVPEEYWIEAVENYL